MEGVGSLWRAISFENGKSHSAKDARPRHVSAARLIIDPPARGAWNMAVDEALLESAGQGVTTLRLYAWSEPTLSLGYFQAAADRQEHAASGECPLVRRASGGGAIIHDRELTYCLAVPIAERFGRAADRLFTTVHTALIAALAELGIPAVLYAPAQPETEEPLWPGGWQEQRRTDAGSIGNLAPAAQPFLCFQRRSPGDVLVGPAKIAGSAQRRQRGGLVQHGSILLAQSAAAPELPGIAEMTEISLSAADLAPRFSQQLASSLGLVWKPSALSAIEIERVASWERDRFAAAAWTCRK